MMGSIKAIKQRFRVQLYIYSRETPPAVSLYTVLISTPYCGPVKKWKEVILWKVRRRIFCRN